VPATIDANTCSFVVGSDICDQVRNWDTWQIVVAEGASLETPLLVGGFERHDGGT
jgi:hypothetical protein